MFWESERQSLIKDDGAWIAVCGELAITMSIREIRRLVDFFEDTEFFIHFLHSPQRQNRGRAPYWPGIAR